MGAPATCAVGTDSAIANSILFPGTLPSFGSNLARRTQRFMSLIIID
ncbi:MAG: hypothetical protein ACI835_005339 [Planctomycetota bacterium]|jgi:hypothetical protein